VTNIPHCCTRLPWDFFIPNVVDQPLSASTKRILGLLSHYLNNYLSLRFLFSSQSGFVTIALYYFMVIKLYDARRKRPFYPIKAANCSLFIPIFFFFIKDLPFLRGGPKNLILTCTPLLINFYFPSHIRGRASYKPSVSRAWGNKKRACALN